MSTGKVKWFNSTKGYGFLVPDDSNEKDVFIHISAANEAGISNLDEGQAISYEIEERNGKESAKNIKLI